MNIVELEKKEYNDFAASQKQSQFLQSWEWGEFQRSAGNKVIRLGIRDDNGLKLAFSLIKKSMPLNKAYFYCPRLGIKYLSGEELAQVFEEIEKIAKEEKVVFLRFEPRTKFNALSGRFMIKKTIDVQPAKTLILDLQNSEEDILKAMHQKTRYNIRLSNKKGVKVVEAGLERFDEFWKLMQETKTRDQFRLHERDYYFGMLKTLRNNRDGLRVKLYFGEYEGGVAAANLVAFFGDMATYMHGASSNEHRNIMAPFALQWEVIKQAKAQGYKYYDFFGIDEKKWPGVTRFKTGFGGETIEYPGVYDIVFDKRMYSLYNIVRKIRRMV